VTERAGERLNMRKKGRFSKKKRTEGSQRKRKRGGYERTLRKIDLGKMEGP